MLICPSCSKENPDDAAFCMACATRLEPAAPAREVRKTVTALFCDLVGSTTLAERHDPEVLKPLLQRYFEEMRAAVERHGGTVEKFIGDAVVAVFGIPQVHEDDALRAVRAAVEMRERLSSSEGAVQLAGRIGVTTGEVLVAGPDQPLIGDTMNTAARLQSAAEPGEILIGEPTHRLVQDAVVAEPVEPVALKGKAEPVHAYRLVQVASLSPMRTRRLDAPMVGRDRESALLQQAFERTVSDRACQLFTVLGSAGAGKSRLVEEFLSGLDGADVMRGRCLPYGEGITYFPVAEAMKEALGLADFDDESSVRETIHASVAEEDHAEAITANLAKLLGAGEGGAPQETFWAIRRFLEVRGRIRPVVVVFDDIHWGESTFLDLIEHVAAWSRDASILVLCMARPDLLDVRPTWAGGKTNATTISLAPLSDRECAELIDHLLGSAGLPGEVRDRITAVAEGNPLFVEEMLRMLIDDGSLLRDGGRWVPAGDLSTVTVPPTISALLSARLDRLSDEERTALERAAVCGKEFHRGAVDDLLPEGARAELDVHLRSLVRKELVTPERSSLPGDDAYRFRHLLIRDAAYDAIPKTDRAHLHEAFATWLERVAGDRVVEQEEIVGYHLERAYRLRVELGASEAEVSGLASEASARLAASGLRAYARGDAAGGAVLLERAFEIAPADDPARPTIVRHLVMAASDAGDFARTDGLIHEARSIAEATGDRLLAAWVRAFAMTDRFLRDPGGLSLEEAFAVTREAVRDLEQVGDAEALGHALVQLAGLEWTVGELEEALASSERALELTRAPGIYDVAITYIGSCMFRGVTPATRGLERMRELEVWCRGDRLATALVWLNSSNFSSTLGRPEEGSRLLDAARAAIDELGNPWFSLMVTGSEAHHLWLAGRTEEAEDRLRAAVRGWEALGIPTNAAMTAGYWVRTLCELGRFEDAGAAATATIGRAGPWDVEAITRIEAGRARALARLGHVEEALGVVRAAEERVRPTGFVELLAEVLLARAEVDHLAERSDEAVAAARESLEIYQRKEFVVEADRARAILASVSG